MFIIHFFTLAAIVIAMISTVYSMKDRDDNYIQRYFPTLAVLTLALIFSMGLKAHAQEFGFSPEARLVVHGTKMHHAAEDTGISRAVDPGVAFWFVEPNLLDGAPEAVAFIGPRFAGADGWIEFMGGGLASPDSDTPFAPVFDLRYSLTAIPWLHFWGEGMATTQVAYTFQEVDVPVRRGKQVLMKIGMEFEAGKAWHGSGGSIGAGPHVIVPFGDHFTLVGAMQVRCSNDGSSAACTGRDIVGRLYVVLDF
ncbi:MAG: hypothetical protein ABIG66_02440 [Candidatus Kerfeldbacteria bacterium]